MTTPFRFGRRPLPIIAFSLGLGLALIGTPWLGLAHAHGGQIEVGEGAKGPVHLSAAQEQAIGLQRVAADFRPLDELLDLNGELQLLPGRQAEVSTRISGQVQAVYATLGDNVRTGQRLARVQSRLVGEPPPSVDIPAPMSGVIDAVSVTLGQSIEPSTVLFHLSDRSRLNFVARVYEEDLGKVHTGQTARVRLLSDPGRTYPGTVTLVGPTFDPATRTVDVWIGLPNPDGRLRPSLFGRASLVLRQNTAALAIPTAAIIEANGEKFVFVHEGDAYQRVEIATGTSDDTYTEVTDGLVPGDEVVTQGARELYTVWLTGGKPAAAED